MCLTVSPRLSRGNCSLVPYPERLEELCLLDTVFVSHIRIFIAVCEFSTNDSFLVKVKRQRKNNLYFNKHDFLR